MRFREQLEGALGEGYTLERELFGGSAARVFVVYEHRLKRRLVVKVVADAAASRSAVERFQHEILLAAKLQQANIVPVLTVGEVGGLLYFTMPLIDGASLEDRLKEHDEGLPYRECITVLRDLTRALEYAHQMGIVHRDIKPGNVLVSGGSAMVMDFGIAKAISAVRGLEPDNARVQEGQTDEVDSSDADDTETSPALTIHGSVAGSPAYMAPEQMSGDGVVDHRADLFAFGCLAYEILTGAPPFSGGSLIAQLTSRLSQAPRHVHLLRPDVPRHVAAVLMKCLEVDPEDRPQSAAEIGQELEARAPGSMWRRWAVAVTLVGAVGYSAALLRRPTEEMPERVLVLPFENRTRDADLEDIGSLSSAAITRATTSAGFVDVLRIPAMLDALLEEAGSVNERFERGVIKQGVTTLITGSYQLRGDTLLVQAQITDIVGATVMEEVGPVQVLVSDPVPGLQALGDRVAGTLAARLDPVLVGLSALTSQPPTFGAYREVSAAEVLARQFDFAAAIEGYARADSIANDPDYFFPRVRTVAMLYELRECVQADSAASALLTRRQALSTYAQLSLDAVIAGCRGDRYSQYDALRRRAAVAPRSTSTLYELGLAALAINRPAEAVEHLEALPSGGTFTTSSGYYQRLQWALHLQGEYQRELEVSQAGVAAAPDRIGLVVFQQLPYAAMGRADDVEALVDHGVTMIDTGGWDTRMVLQMAAMELRAHGDAPASRRMGRRLVDWLMAQPVEERDGDNPFVGVSREKAFDMVLARAHYLAGDFAAADSVLDSSPWPQRDRLEYLSWKGVIAAELGEEETARAISAELAGLRSEYSLGEDLYARGRIAAALGDQEDAVRLLQDAVRGGVYFIFRSYHWHSDPALEPLREHPAYQRLVAPKG